MKISVLGCGWLGLPLAKALLAQGHTIKGSVTGTVKFPVLKEAGIQPYAINLEDADAKEITGFLAGTEVLIINIPPKAKTALVPYPQKMAVLLPFIETSGITKVLFVSSTSVFAEGPLPYPEITDTTPPNPDTDNGRQIVAAEKVLQSGTAFKSTILRFAGLIGPDRHPVYHLAGRQNIASPDAPVNLISLYDCIDVITKIIDTNAWGITINAASSYHPSRRDYYTQKATALGLPQPMFDEAVPSTGKTVTTCFV